MPHPALLSPHSLFGGREKGKRKGKKVQRRHPPRSHPIRGKAPPQNASKKNSGANAPKLAKEVQKSSSSFPHQKKPGCTRPPPPPLSVQSTASPNPHWHAFSGAALGVGVGAIIGGEGTSSFGSIRRPKQGKKKKSTTRLSCHGAERSLGGSEPPSRAHPETDCVFWGRSLEKQLRFGGVARADPKKDLLSFCCFGEPSRGVVWRGRSWGCYFPESPRGSAGRSRPGAGREKKGEGICAGQDLERVPGLHVRVDKEVHV